MSSASEHLTSNHFTSETFETNTKTFRNSANWQNKIKVNKGEVRETKEQE